MGGGRDELDELSTLGRELEGIYDVTDHMTNLEACETGGLQVAGHGHLAIFVLGAGSAAQVRVISCEDVDACRASVDAAMSGEAFSVNFSFVFDTVDDGNTLLGTDAVAVQEGEICYRKLTEAVLSRAQDGTLSIEARFWRGDDYTPDDRGSCSSSKGDAPSMGEPCSELETLDAMHVADLER